MKRRSYHDRARAFDARLLKPSTDGGSSDSFGFLPRGRQSGPRAKRIFVIRQAVQLPPTNSGERKQAQHILIFDDHPDSLRLVLGPPANPRAERSVSRRATLWVALFSMLMLSLLIAMFWPLF
jgi:hypothetical protein